MSILKVNPDTLGGSTQVTGDCVLPKENGQHNQGNCLLVSKVRIRSLLRRTEEKASFESTIVPACRAESRKASTPDLRMLSSRRASPRSPDLNVCLVQCIRDEGTRVEGSRCGQAPQQGPCRGLHLPASTGKGVVIYVARAQVPGIH